MDKLLGKRILVYGNRYSINTHNSYFVFLYLSTENISAYEATFQQIEERLRDQLLKSLQKQTFISPFNYQSEWWQDYSWLYRHVQGWQCEACKLSLDLDRQYLHTHHLNGTLYNDPKDLQALCIACHSEQPGANHKKLATEEDYHKFKEKYGDQWRLRKSRA